MLLRTHPLKSVFPIVHKRVFTDNSPGRRRALAEGRFAIGNGCQQKKEGRRKGGSDKAKVDERKRKGEIASSTISISASSAVKGIKNRIKTSFITEGSPVVS